MGIHLRDPRFQNFNKLMAEIRQSPPEMNETLQEHRVLSISTGEYQQI